MSLIRLIGPVAIAAATFGLFDCQKKVVLIKYSQAVNCSYFDLDPALNPKKHTKYADTGKILVVYKIHSIQNNDPDAVDFNFLLSKVFAGDENQRPEELEVWAGATEAPDQPQSIPKGSTIAPNWRFFIQVARDPSQVKTATEDLHYKSVPGESVLMVNVSKDGKTAHPPPEFQDPCYPGGISKDN